ncbi:hypothetical protein OG21DRAFT_1509028 [Imleria badia]|nr:hypothetical protein OG21DRAFT_1509028 [Imleria badia]
MKLPLATPKPLPSISEALIGAFPTHYTSHRLPRCGTRASDDGKWGAQLLPGPSTFAGRSDVGTQAFVRVVVHRRPTEVITQAMPLWDVFSVRYHDRHHSRSRRERHVAFSPCIGTPGCRSVCTHPEVLMRHESPVVRATPATQGDTGREAQLRLAEEFYKTVGNTTPMLQG